MSYTHAVYSIEDVGKLFVFHAFIDIPSSLVETKLIFAKVQRALRSIFHGGRSDNPRSTRRARIIGNLSTDDTEGTDILELLRKKSLEEIFFKDVADARNQSSEFKRN